MAAAMLGIPNPNMLVSDNFQCNPTTYRVSNLFNVSETAHNLRMAAPGTLKHLLLVDHPNLNLRELCLLLDAVSHHAPHLHSVDFSRMGFDVCFLTYVFDFLSRCTSIRRVDLQGNYLTPGTASDAAHKQEEALCRKAALSPITNVNIDGPRLLGEALKGKSNLVYLNVSQCCLKDESVEWLIKALTSEAYYREDQAIARVHSYSTAYPGVTAARNEYNLEHKHVNSVFLGGADKKVDGSTLTATPTTITCENAPVGLNVYLSHNLLTNAVYKPVLEAVLAQEDTSAPATSPDRFSSPSAVVTYVCMKGNHVARDYKQDIITKCAAIQQKLQSNFKLGLSMEKERMAESARIKSTFENLAANVVVNSAEVEAKAKGSHLGFLVYGVEPDTASSFPTLGGMVYLLETSK